MQWFLVNDQRDAQIPFYVLIFYLYLSTCFAHDTATDTQWQLPEVVLIQFVSPDDEHDVLETCREL